MAKTLTVKALEAMKPGPARREVPDGLLSGLYFIIQPSGASSWALRYRFNGSPKKLTIGPYPALSLAKARELAGAAVSAIAEGRDPGEEKKAARRPTKEVMRDDIETVAGQFIERHGKSNMRESSRLEAERLLNHDIIPAWKGRSIKSITRRDVVELLDGIVDRGALVTANRVLALVRRVFNWAIDRGIVDSSPVTNMSPPTQEKSRDRVLSDAELLRVLKAADSLGWPFGPFVRLLILTGQRLSEVAEMTWAELDLADETKAIWSLSADRVKNGVQHQVDLSPQAVNVISQLPKILDGKKEPNLVFTTTGKTPISGWSRAKNNLDAAIAKAMQDEAAARGDTPADVRPMPDWRFHDLRRTMASGMARLGVQIHIVEKVLNHVSGSFAGIVGVYQRHDFAEEKRAALLAWGRHVESLEVGKPSNVIEIKKRAQ